MRKVRSQSWHRARARACLVCLFTASSAAVAASYDFSIDLRAVDSNGRDSYRDGGLGKLRYDEDDSGLHLGRLRAAVTQPIGEVFSAHAEVSSWGDNDKNPVDLTEAFVEYRPYPHAGFRSRVRLGAFYPPMSLENRALGWETPYTITPSAIGTWIGEELRTIGLEGQVDWLGTRMGHAFDLQLTGALFGWNDPAGVMMALHGFAFDDRQTTLFGRVGQPGAKAVPDREVFHEVDRRPGFYVGAQARYLDRAVLNVLHYDNRANPSAYSAKIDDFAWETSFDAAALRVETASDWTLLVQWLQGETYIAPNGYWLEWEFNSRSALLAKTMGRHMLTARYDTFEVETDEPSDPGNEDGHAWTVAYSFAPRDNWRFMLEWLRVRSDVKARPVSLGEPALATETKVELSVRYSIGVD
ncbi:MAG TPA: hypothetical protein VMS40_27275 [Vicinamibacterales bacterium]|nr:hypothetical protein [Vicinamibacterales bacterium]